MRHSAISDDQVQWVERNKNDMKNRIDENKNELENIHFQQIFKEKLGLKRLIKKHKVRAIVNNFHQKARRNNAGSTPLEYDPYEDLIEEGFSAIEGFKIPVWLSLLKSFLSIFFNLLLFFSFTIALVF